MKKSAIALLALVCAIGLLGGAHAHGYISNPPAKHVVRWAGVTRQHGNSLGTGGGRPLSSYGELRQGRADSTQTGKGCGEGGRAACTPEQRPGTPLLFANPQNALPSSFRLLSGTCVRAGVCGDPFQDASSSNVAGIPFDSATRCECCTLARHSHTHNTHTANRDQAVRQ